MRFTEHSRLLAALILLAVFAICSAAAAKVPVLKIATTTNVDNTGFLDYMAPIFFQDTGIETQWVSVGTDKALEYGRNGDVDVVLTHGLESDEKFMSDDAGVNRSTVMYNDFVLIGPPSDPAGVEGKPIIEAVKMIAAKKQPLVSCADKLWTHSAELKLFAEAGIKNFDKDTWYVQTGHGMLQAVNVAAERGGYALVDRDTYIEYKISQKDNPPLVILVHGGKQLLSVYSVMAVNPKKHSRVQYNLAMKYINWLTSVKVRKDIANFKLGGERVKNY